MRKLNMLLLMAAFIICLGGISAQAAETSIAVVDVQKLMTESKAAKDIQQQMQKKKDSFLAELSKEETELRDKEKKLVAEKANLSEEEFAKKAKEFEQKLIETRKAAQGKKRTIDEASAKALAKLRNEIYKVVEVISAEKGYNLVISRQYVVLGEKSIDISDEAMTKLDAAITKIPLEAKGK